MRITVTQLFLSMFFTFTLLAKGGAGQEVLERRVSLKAEQIEISKLLNAVKEQTGVRFIFSSKVIKANRKLSVNSKEKRLAAFLDEYLKPLGIGYNLVNDQILLFASNEASTSAANRALDEFREKNTLVETITGLVKDQNGVALAGASVVLKSNSKVGTITDAIGRFSLPVESLPVTLIISYTGYAMSEVTVISASITVDVQLAALVSNTMSDVVVVGYGTQRRRDLTGSISRVSEQAIKLTPVNSADQAIQGRVAGVQVLQSSGAPGGAVQVRVRGVNSTAGGGANQPLYVVDGVPLVFNEGINSLSVGNEGSSGGAGSNGASPLNTISPNDIESIEVLKDASATAIYGARAANGVVLITTKSGRQGKPQVSLNVTYGLQSLRKKIPLLNGKERAAMIFEHRRNRGTAGNEIFDIWAINPYLITNGADWQDEVFRTAPIANYNLGVNGGSDRITYSISGDYMDQQGIVMNTYAKRAGMRVNMDVRAADKLKFGTRTNLSSQWDNGVITDEFFQSELMNLLTNSPISPVWDANGNYVGRPNPVINENLFITGGRNVVANLAERERTAMRNRVISSVYGEYAVSPALKFKSSLGIDYLLTNLREMNPYWVRGIDVNQPVRLSQSNNATLNWISEQTLSYNKKFGEHAVDAVAGFSAQNVNIKTMSAAANGSLNNNLDQLGNNPTISAVSGGESDQGLVSQFLRTNYNYRGKYLLTATIRRDGSSRFGGNNKYGIFPSASVGWRISQEEFLADNRVISDMKIRASYGSTGNQEILNFLYEPLMFGNTAVWGTVSFPVSFPVASPIPIFVGSGTTSLMWGWIWPYGKIA